MTDTTSVEIAARLEDVWSVLADVEAWPTWTPTVTAVRAMSGGTPGPGADYELEQPRLPRATWEIAVWDPPSQFDWVSRAPGVLTEASHVLVGNGDGTTLTLSITRQGFLAPLVDRLYGRLTREYLATEAASLKARCEGTSAA